MILVLVSNIVAWPLTYFIMNKVLQNYAYRTDLDILTFLLPTVIIFFLALVTISFQVVKIARTNPVNSLRYE